ncbi:hypothetical protein GCM10007908_05420 [Rhizobium albus]|nr:hypothetical protein GCM10007908_05420 [Rhizobium albus]
MAVAMQSRLRQTLPLTLALPLFVAVAIFVVAVGTTQLGIRLLQSNSESALRDQAAVFLDALAGNIAAETSDTPAAVERQLEASLTYRTALLEEAMAARWTDVFGTTQTMVLGEAHRSLLVTALDDAANLGAGETVFSAFPDRGLLLVLRTYAMDDRVLFLAATFDTTPVKETADTASGVALGIDFLVAIIAAIAVYVITWRALAPLDAFINRLADQDALTTALVSWRQGDELRQLEAALALRERSEAERMKLLEQMAQQERDALLARMAAGIAHEVRNPLAGLKNGVSTLKRYGDRPDVREQTLDLLEKGLDSIGRVVDVTLSTYRRRSGTSRLFARDIRDLDLLIQPEARRFGVQLEWVLDEAVAIDVDGDALRQILINLLLNAVRASPAKGKVTVTLAQDVRENTVSIEIQDEGQGMPPEMVAAIISGQLEAIPAERGIGIWVIANLVEQIGASLSIRSEDGAGTMVRITLAAPTAPAATNG